MQTLRGDALQKPANRYTKLKERRHVYFDPGPQIRIDPFLCILVTCCGCLCCIASFDMPTKCTNAATPPDDCAFEGTLPASVNLLGQVVGTYYGEDGNPHGFLRDADGSMKKVDAPAAGNFSDVQSINNFGQMTGYVMNSSGVARGLLVKP